MKKLATLCLSASLLLCVENAASAKTFDWPIGSPAAKAETFTAYHGETVRFNLRLSGPMTNLAPVAIYYQTNGMDKADFFPPIPGTVFHPTNDCGAAAYRFFILCTDPDGRNYTANGTLRMLDSPGFEPSVVSPPVKTLDFSTVTVLNAPWIDPSATNALAASCAQASRAATNYTYSATNSLDVVLRREIAAATPGDYTAVSNAAMEAVQWQSGGLYKHQLMADKISAIFGVTTLEEFEATAGMGQSTYYGKDGIRYDYQGIGAQKIYFPWAEEYYGITPDNAKVMATRGEIIAATNSIVTTESDPVAMAAIADLDTSYRRYVGLTNVNQSVQYVATDSSTTEIAILAPTSGDTKDWVVYVYPATNLTFTLPTNVTWWTSDASNTNEIPAATPTALYFSQVSDSIFLLGRQELIEIGGAE